MSKMRIKRLTQLILVLLAFSATTIAHCAAGSVDTRFTWAGNGKVTVTGSTGGYPLDSYPITYTFSLSDVEGNVIQAWLYIATYASPLTDWDFELTDPGGGVTDLWDSSTPYGVYGAADRYVLYRYDVTALLNGLGTNVNGQYSLEVNLVTARNVWDHCLGMGIVVVSADPSLPPVYIWINDGCEWILDDTAYTTFADLGQPYPSDSSATLYTIVGGGVDSNALYFRREGAGDLWTYLGMYSSMNGYNFDIKTSYVTPIVKIGVHTARFDSFTHDDICVYSAVLSYNPTVTNNQPPVADTGGPYITYVTLEVVPLPVNLDASQSYDPNGLYDHIVSYDWDTDDDGLYGSDDDPDDPTGMIVEGFVDNNWQAGRTYLIHLRVTDTFGAVGFDDSFIEVMSIVPPNVAVERPSAGESLHGASVVCFQVSQPQGKLVVISMFLNDAAIPFTGGNTVSTPLDGSWVSVERTIDTTSYPDARDFYRLKVVAALEEDPGIYGVALSPPFTIDNTSPTITAPADITVEQTSPAGATISSLGTPTVSDTIDLDPAVTNDAPAIFPPGVTTVTWTATDASGNMAQATQTVTVQDTIPPTITAPADITVQQNNPGGATVSSLGTPIVSDAVDPNPVVTNDAPAIFPVGVTPVTWTAVDASRNSATATQLITVTPAQYTLTVNIVGSGTVTVDPDQATYQSGSTVQLTAIPAIGWSFGGWNGGLSGDTNPETLTIDENKAVTATFTAIEYTLSVTPSTGGSVTLDPDQTTYHYGDVVELTAVPDEGYMFIGWGGDLSGSDNPEAILMDGEKSVTATFIPSMWTITASAGQGGSITPSGEITVNLGATQVFTIIPDVGYQILDVTVDGISHGAIDSYTFTSVNDNHIIEASFAPTQYYLTLETDPANIETVDQSAISGEGWYSYGSTATFSAETLVTDWSQMTRWEFTEWTTEGGTSMPGNPVELVMNGAYTFIAKYDVQSYYLFVTTNPLEVLDIDPTAVQGEGWYDSGSYAIVDAKQTVASGLYHYEFIGWGSQDQYYDEDDNPVTLPPNQAAHFMDSSYTMVAQYELVMDFNWEYVYTDYNSVSTLKISTDDGYFEFSTPDKTYLPRKADRLVMTRHSLEIIHSDLELNLVAYAITDSRVDFCLTYGKDVATGQRYVLRDKIGLE